MFDKLLVPVCSCYLSEQRTQYLDHRDDCPVRVKFLRLMGQLMALEDERDEARRALVEAQAAYREVEARWAARNGDAINEANRARKAEAALVEAETRVQRVEELCQQAEANPEGWGGSMVISFARSVAAALSAPEPQ